MSTQSRVILIALLLLVSLIGGLTITLTGAYRLRRQIATEQMQRNSATYLRFNKK